MNWSPVSVTRSSERGMNAMPMPSRAQSAAVLGSSTVVRMLSSAPVTSNAFSSSGTSLRYAIRGAPERSSMRQLASSPTSASGGITATSGSAAANRHRRPSLLKGVRTTPMSTIPPSSRSITAGVAPSCTSYSTLGKRRCSSRSRPCGMRPEQPGSTPMEMVPPAPVATSATSRSVARVSATILRARS